MKLDKSVAAVVTGGASGLGAGTARALAAQGVRVCIFDMNEAGGRAVADEIGGSFARVDVADDASTEAGFEAARKAHGQERILVNCAGIAIGQKTVARNRDTGVLTRHAMADFERVIRINLLGTFRCASIAAAGMITAERLEDGERGLIVNTASVAATDGQIGQAAYSASKGGVLGMGLPIARDLAAEGIRVMTIQPGIMETPMVAAMPEKVREALAASIPFPSRLGRPDDYASLVLEFCRNIYLNGESVRLDGGVRLAPR